MVGPYAAPLEEIQKIPLFKGVSIQDLKKIIQSAHQKKIAEDEFFFMQGDPAEKMFILLTGRVRLFQTSREGDQVLIRVITPYTLFALVALTQTQVYPVNAQAAEESFALYWSKVELMDIVIQYPVVAINAMKMMAEQVKELQDRLRQTSTERVDQRLARTLIRLGSQAGKNIDEGILIDMPLTRQELAEMAGTTLFTVSRTLSRWEEQGLVICGRERVVIRLPHGLLEIAGDVED
jgi:CRP/FNR family transcriptional regulator, nitrogen oxide reductase regulator